MSVKPPYYKVLWHKCYRCFTHYTSEEPHLRAYLCDECWNALPHYTTPEPKPVKQIKENKPTMTTDTLIGWIVLYISFVISLLMGIYYSLWGL